MRAIINEPKVLLLDELMAALDAKLRAEMQRELLDLQRSLGITFVLVTHDQEEALSMSDRIYIMGKGRIAQVGTPQELYDRPANRYVADFVGRANIFSGEIASRADGLAKVALPGGQTVLVRDGDETGRLGAVEVAVRPEVLSLAAPTDPVAEGNAAILAEVTHRTFLGDHIEYLLRSESLGPLCRSSCHDRPKEPRVVTRWGPAST
ncbi:MAG: ABC transporter ATP-binding protein [Breoghania sp.]|nr:ABC transporter ATP-binding protein [Breoghania sp.]MDJ0933125.1 ABC transporter ATP-binding protein [Breoghania sp.]